MEHKNRANKDASCADRISGTNDARTNIRHKLSVKPSLGRKVKYSISAAGITALTGIIGLSQSLTPISSALSISSLSEVSGSTDGGNEIIVKGEGFLKSIEKQDKIAQIAGGVTGSDGTVFTVTENGQVYSYGDNKYGHAGTGVACNTSDSSSNEAPCFYKDPQDITAKFNGERVNKIYSDGIAITDKHVYMWGMPGHLSPAIVQDTSDKHIIGSTHFAAFSDTTLFYYDYTYQQDQATVKIKSSIDLSKYLDGSHIQDYAYDDKNEYILTDKGAIIQITRENDTTISSYDDITKLFGGNVKQLISPSSYRLVALTDSGQLVGIDSENASLKHIADNVEAIAGYDDSALYFVKDDGELYTYSNTVQSTGIGNMAIYTYGSNGISFAQSTSSDKICSRLIVMLSIDDFKPCVTIPLQSYKTAEPSVESLAFGDITTDKFTIIDDNTIKVTVPPHTAGRVDVTITDNDGKKTTTLKNGYTYIDGTESQSPDLESKPQSGNNPSNKQSVGSSSISASKTTIAAPNTGV